MGVPVGAHNRNGEAVPNGQVRPRETVVSRTDAVRRRLRKAWAAGLYALGLPLAAVERLLLSRSDVVGPVLPPMFIVGPPRSGTTLAYQLIAQGFRVCYFSNASSAFPSSPVQFSWLTRGIGGCEPSESFTSHYGRTPGWNSPHQGWQIWARWLPVDQRYVPAGSLEHRDLDDMRRTVGLIERIYRQPFVNKWNGLNSMLNPLLEAFPNGVYIRVHRDPQQVVESILRGRQAVWGDTSHWLSTKPSTYASIVANSDDPIEQVCLQVRDVERDLDRDGANIGSERFLRVDYEELCNDPRGFLARLSSHYVQCSEGHELAPRRLVPHSFDVRTKSLVDAPTRTRIREVLSLFA